MKFAFTASHLLIFIHWFLSQCFLSAFSVCPFGSARICLKFVSEMFRLTLAQMWAPKRVIETIKFRHGSGAVGDDSLGGEYEGDGDGF